MRTGWLVQGDGCRFLWSIAGCAVVGRSAGVAFAFPRVILCNAVASIIVVLAVAER